MRLQDKLKELQESKKAILATNFYNFETLRGVLEAAREKNSPIILQLTKSSINYMGLQNAVSLAESALSHYGVVGWLHLDHGDSYQLIEQCLEAGIRSVMYDGSELSFEENISNTKKVVELAKKYGANVEAELGYVAKLGQSTEKLGFTDPEQAKLFVEKTRINALAIAIGTAHGFYKSKPNLDFERLANIKEKVDINLVLHGGSGVPDDQIQKAISLGICKINLATEIKNTFMLSLKELLANNVEIDLRKVFPPAIKSVKDLVCKKIEMINQ